MAAAPGEQPQLMEHVQQARVDGIDLVGAVVAQQHVDAGPGVGEIVGAVVIFDGQALARVQVVEGQLARPRCRHDGRRQERHGKARGDAREQASAP